MDKNLPRYFIKIVRDGIKTKYKKGTECRICDTEENLEFHHYKTVSILVNTWVAERGLTFDGLEDAQVARDEFNEANFYDMTENAVTLCKKHHEKLHSIYGAFPLLSTSEKQQRWVERMREKNGLV